MRSNEALLGIFNWQNQSGSSSGPLLQDGTLSSNAHDWVPQLEMDFWSINRQLNQERILLPSWHVEHARVKLLRDREKNRIPYSTVSTLTYPEATRMQTLDVMLDDYSVQLAHLRDSTETETGRPFKWTYPLATGTKCQF